MFTITINFVHSSTAGQVLLTTLDDAKNGKTPILVGGQYYKIGYLTVGELLVQRAKSSEISSALLIPIEVESAEADLDIKKILVAYASPEDE